MREFGILRENVGQTSIIDVVVTIKNQDHQKVSNHHNKHARILTHLCWIKGIQLDLALTCNNTSITL